MLSDNLGILMFGVFLCVMFSWLILMVCAIFSILVSHKDPGIKALWVLACLGFPYLGSILWFIYGKKSNF